MTTHFPFTDSYSTALLLEGMMGPNAMRIMEELTARLDIQPGMRILDLGCGKGLSSILLAEKYAATVFAADLWISPTENAQRFAGLKLEKQIFPLLVDATQPSHSPRGISISSSASMLINTLVAMTSCWENCCPT